MRTENTDCISNYDLIFLDLPNVITLNGDGKNDVLDLSFLKKAANSTLEIFDRYGRKVLSLNNNSSHQDYKNFFTGTYWYIFTNEIGAKKSGWIVVKNR